jgi:tetratricopeptide (TPR) repeat protein
MGTRTVPMELFTAKSVARMSGLSVRQVRSYARAGFLQAERGPSGEYLFSFQDLVLLKTARNLLAARVAPWKILRTLNRLKQQLPGDRPLTGVHLSAEGADVIVRDGESAWNPLSGQACLDFGNGAGIDQAEVRSRRTDLGAPESEESMEAQDWAALGRELEAAAPEHAREAYRRALELNPNHVETRARLGNLLQEEGALESAEAHFRLALAIDPTYVTALFHLGVCLEDQGKTDEAVRIYKETIELDADCADAFHNIACLLEELGEADAALDYFKTYRKLTED